MKLSIIIPVYRVEKTLRHCVCSVTSQSFANFEIILVDDGSPDNCGVICDELSAGDNRIRVIHRENGGLSAARNTGINAATGDYITFIDSDDAIAQGSLQELISILEEHPEYDIIEYPVIVFHGSTKEHRLDFGNREYHYDFQLYWHENAAYTHAYAWNKIYKRHLFKDIRFPEGKVFEDVWTIPLLLERADIIRTTNRGLYYYNANTEGITSKADGHDLKMLLEAHIKIMENKSLLSVPYYMHVVNIQLDVYNGTGEVLLPEYETDMPGLMKLGTAMFLKGLIIKISGIRTLCKIHRIFRNLL